MPEFDHDMKQRSLCSVTNALRQRTRATWGWTATTSESPVSTITEQFTTAVHTELDYCNTLILCMNTGLMVQEGGQRERDRLVTVSTHQQTENIKPQGLVLDLKDHKNTGLEVYKGGQRGEYLLAGDRVNTSIDWEHQTPRSYSWP